MDPEELVARARVVALPMRERFRGIDVREAVLIEGAEGRWAEWSPFTEYDDAEASVWLGAALEELATPPSREVGTVRVNATVPAIHADAVPALLARFPGCRTAKVKVAQPGQSLDDDLARVAAVRDVLGPHGRIRVDANAAWSLDEAERALVALARYDLEYAEQPVASIQDLALLRGRLRPLVPIAADESIRRPADPLEVVRAGAADIVVLKLQPLGGARRALGIAQHAVAESDVRVVTSSALETSVGLAAAARFARMVDAAFGSDLDHGLGTAALLAADVTAEPLRPAAGAIAVRDVVPDPELLERYAAPADRREWWLERLRRCTPTARCRRADP